MGALFDILKDIPLSSVLKERIATFEDENAALKTEVAILKDDKHQLEAENQRLKEQIQRLTHKDDLEETERRLLVLLAKGEHQFTSQIAESLGLPEPKIEYYIQEMVTNGYLEDRFAYPVAQKGRKYLIDNALL